MRVVMCLLLVAGYAGTVGSGYLPILILLRTLVAGYSVCNHFVYAFRIFFYAIDIRYYFLRIGNVLLRKLISLRPWLALCDQSYITGMCARKKIVEVKRQTHPHTILIINFLDVPDAQ